MLFSGLESIGVCCVLNVGLRVWYLLSFKCGFESIWYLLSLNMGLRVWNLLHFKCGFEGIADLSSSRSAVGG